MVSSIFKNGKNFVTKKQETIISSAVVMMAATLLTKILGIAKLSLLSNTLGAGAYSDIFFAANTIPDLLFNILVMGALNTALIPVLLGVMHNKGEERMWRVFNTFLTLSGIFLIVTGILGIIFSRYITFYTVNLYNLQNPHAFTFAQRDLMTQMMRVMFISPVILGVSFLISAVMTVYRRFLVTQLASVLYTLGFIAGIVFFVPIMGVMGLAWGVVFGSLMHLVIQYPVLKHLGYKYSFKIIIDENVKNIGRLMAPRVVGLAGDQIVTYVYMVLALGLPKGSWSIFNYASSLAMFPISLVGWSFAQASFISLSESYSKGDFKSFKVILNNTFQQITFLTLPLVIIFMILRFPIVRLVLGQGKNSQFDWNSTQIASMVLLFLALGILSQAILSLLIRAFYSMHDTKTPLKTRMVSLVVNIGLSFYLIQVFGRFNPNVSTVSNLLNVHWKEWAIGSGLQAVGGLALAGTIAATVDVVLLFVILNKRLSGFGIDEFWEPLSKKFISAACMGWVMYILFKYIDSHIDTTKTFDELFLFCIVSFIGLILYVLLESLLKDREIALVYKIWLYIKNILKTRILPSVQTLPDLIVEEEGITN